MATASERIREARDKRERFGFFLEHAGYSVPPGRAVRALGLARAEQLLEQAQGLGVAAVEWLDDDHPYDGGDAWTDEQIAEKFESGEWVGPFGCVVSVGRALDAAETAATADVTESLWGIVVNAPTWQGDDPYVRVVQAELACGLEDDLRQAVGDARDARQCVGEVA